MLTADYRERDKEGAVAFYVLLWKRRGISLQLFDDYWRNVHGPVCARLPGQYQYFQFHLARNEGGLWPKVDGVETDSAEEDQFHGIAELTFRSPADRETWFDAATILMDDEHNLFSKAIGYNSNPGNSITYVDGIENGTPNGVVGVQKFHVMVKKADGASIEQFRGYLVDTFAAKVLSSNLVPKLRVHLFEEVDRSRPEAAGVLHAEPPEKSYHAAFEIAFSNRLDMENFFACDAYAAAIENQGQYVKQISPFPERTAYTFVQGGRMTLAGERTSTVAELITGIGATNQLRGDIVELMLGKR